MATAVLSSTAQAVDIGFEEPEYTSTAGHGTDGGLAGQGDNVNNPGCGGTEIGCWQNLFNPDGFTVTPSVGFGGSQGLAYEGGEFAPHVFKTDDTLLGGTFDSASSVLDYSFLFRMDSFTTGNDKMFSFGVGQDHFPGNSVFQAFPQDKGGFGFDHGNGATFLTAVSDPGSLLLPAPAFNVINGQIDYANQTFTIFFNGIQYNFQSPGETGDYPFASTSANALNNPNIVLLASNHGGALDGTYTIDDLSLGIATVVTNPGDFNDDGVVNAADYTVWLDNLGAADESALNGNGDGANGVDQNDYTLWNTNFGATGVTTSGSAVPEPSSLALIFCVAVTGLAGRRQR